MVATRPVLGRGYTEDSRVLTEYLAHTGELLDALPAKPERDPGQRRAAERTHAAARAVRRRFLDLYDDRVYDELTDGGRRHLRPDELIQQAADARPGLVPAKPLLEQERLLPQAAKEGWEIDQGAFLRSLLGSEATGRRLLDAARRPTAHALAALAAFQSTGHADLGTVTVRRRDGVAEVTIDNGRFLNAEDEPLVAALEVAVDLVLLDDAVHVGVLRGAPMRHPRYAGRRVFSAGINLTRLHRGEISLLGFFIARELGYINKMFRGIPAEDGGDAVEKPWVGVVDTFAIGGGTQILLVLDHVVAEPGSYLRLPALQEGIIPGAANLRLPRVAGNRLARQAIFANRRIEADSPAGRLFCDEVVEPDRLDEAIDAAAARLANPAVVANRRTLHRFEEPEDAFREYMAVYAAEQSRLLHGPHLVANLERLWISRKR